MSIRFSIFDSVRLEEKYVPALTARDVEADSWRQFVDILYAHSQVTFKSKAQSPLISPAYYGKNKHRKNTNVVGWSFLALDVDGGADFYQVQEQLERQELNFFMHTTASHTEEKHKFRVFVEIVNPVIAEDVADFWHGANHRFGGIADQQCKDKSRGYYLPSNLPGLIMAHNITGFPLKTQPLIQYGEENRPQDIRLAVTQELRRHSFEFEGLDDCPFVEAAWVREYMKLPNGQGMHYQALFRFMLRVCWKASKLGVSIEPQEVAWLAALLDLRKDGRWCQVGRPLDVEAANAAKFVFGGVSNV